MRVLKFFLFIVLVGPIFVMAFADMCLRLIAGYNPLYGDTRISRVYDPLWNWLRK